MVEQIKCNCTVCGSRFRVTVDRKGNIKDEPYYCVFCRAMLEEVDPSKVQECLGA